MSTTNPTSTSIYQTRQSRLDTILYHHGLDILALNPGPSLAYLTGLHFHLSERPVVAFFSRHNPPVLVLPELEAGKIAELPFAVQIFPYGEDPAGWQGVFLQAAQAVQLEQRKVGVDPGGLRFLELSLMQAAAETAQFLSAADGLAELRIRKDPDELQAMQTAVEIAQKALQATLPQVKIGMSERELASELVLQLLRAGSDGDFPFMPIVSGGPNSANPHAVPGDRPLQPGDLLVIDWGASHDGYCSDLTRTFAIGEVAAEWQHIHQVVQQANAAGRAAGKPGAAAEEVDKAARAVIEASGYGQYFIHRTGHGLGLEAHEPPYIRSGNTQLLEPGMTYTVEPGIYLQGHNGVRIEDNIVITAQGASTLSSLPRELQVLG